MNNCRKKRRLARIRKRLEKKFDELYAKAEEILSKYKPCKITVIKGKVHCVGCSGRNPPNELCCGGCQFHTVKGCIADKPLTCKLWLCNTARNDFPECDDELDVLRDKAAMFWVYRGYKQSSLKHASHELVYLKEA